MVIEEHELVKQQFKANPTSLGLKQTTKFPVLSICELHSNYKLLGICRFKSHPFQFCI